LECEAAGAKTAKDPLRDRTQQECRLSACWVGTPQIEPTNSCIIDECSLLSALVRTCWTQHGLRSQGSTLLLRTATRRRAVQLTDALLNYETVKYFTNEALEAANYASAITAYQASEAVLLISLSALNLIQGLIMFCGVAAGMTVCAAKVTSGVLSVGDAVLFLTLMSQIYAPLNYFGSYYRQIQRQMIDMENMFDLLATRGAVEDVQGAGKLQLYGGAIELRNVWFGYKPDRIILKGINLTVCCALIHPENHQVLSL
jgi:ABC-type transport system involved in Fe-S cluster assembly fused permease/ATPase subunit